LVIDEVYAYTKAELHALLWKAARAKVKVVLLGDRRQQYEDGGELRPSDLTFYGIPCVRMCVSNTMPVDAMSIAKWAADGDDKIDWFQTRNKRIHSIRFVQKESDDARAICDWVTKGDQRALVFKDRLNIPVGYSHHDDESLGFKMSDEESWLSTSRTQGSRTRVSVLLCGLVSAAEKWYASQPGLFYVATSRHSESMLYVGDVFDLHHFKGLLFEPCIDVNGRMSLLTGRENFSGPLLVATSKFAGLTDLSSRLLKIGHAVTSIGLTTTGHVREDWRPWSRLDKDENPEAAVEVFAAATDALVGAEVPYVETDAVKRPIYQRAMGLHSIRRPDLWPGDRLKTSFPGLSRLAVQQNSKDEVLDQKNVVERAARPRSVDERPMVVELQAQHLFEGFKKAYLVPDLDGVSISTSTDAFAWAASRSSAFVGKLLGADYYGITAFSTRSQGFLKTQVKVKLKSSFALEENYGQTVLASPADFNAIYGPWSKMFLRNLRLCTRPGVIFDSGYSDRELARELRENGALAAFQNENLQSDVSRQDTSHNAVTLRVFCKVMELMGVPKDLCDLYELHSKRYDYRSMKSGLYAGTAAYNLGSGDPFTLIRNICQLATVNLERFGPDQLSGVRQVLKGDDYIADKVMKILPATVPELRAVKLTVEVNKPPYHAGRFFLPDDVVPDPVRMVAKILVKQTDDKDRANELAMSFYDRYVILTPYSYALLKKYVVEAYSDFSPELPLAALDLYNALRCRDLFYQLISPDTSSDKRLVVVDSEGDCAAQAAAWFIRDNAFLHLIRGESIDVVEMHLARVHVPTFRVRGDSSDFKKEGVWLSAEHAWAVIGLTEFKERSAQRGLEDSELRLNHDEENEQFRETIGRSEEHFAPSW